MKFLSCYLIVLIFLTPAGYSQAQSNNRKDLDTKFTIQNCVNQFNQDSVVKTKVGYQYWFADKDFLDGRTLKMSVVKPHEATHPPHKHSEDEFFFVLEGTAEFYLDGQTVVSGPYTSFYCPPNIAHGIKNVGNTELKYLVIKKYEKNNTYILNKFK